MKDTLKSVDINQLTKEKDWLKMRQIASFLALFYLLPLSFATPVTFDEQKPILTVRFSDETVENIGIVTAGRPLTISRKTHVESNRSFSGLNALVVIMSTALSFAGFFVAFLIGRRIFTSTKKLG